MEIVNNHPSTPNQMKLAVAAYAKAFGLFRKQKWYWMLLVPILLNVVLFYWGIAQVNVLTETTFNFIESLTADWYSAEMGSGIFNEFIRITLWVFFKIAYFILFAYVGGYFVILCLSPFLSIISEKTEKIYGKIETPFSLPILLKSIFRGVLMASRNFILQTIATVTVFFFGFIPLVGGLVAPILMIVVSAYFYGFTFMDYYIERKIETVNGSVHFVRKRRAKSVFIGMPFVVVLAIPVIGPFAASFFTILSTIAASISLIDEKQ